MVKLRQNVLQALGHRLRTSRHVDDERLLSDSRRGARQHGYVIVAYGVNILSVSDNLMNNVKYKVEEFTGMTVDKINIFVEGVRVID